MPGDASTASQIPGPPTEDDGGAAIAAAGGLHNYQLELHGEYGPVVRFPLPGAGLAVSVADPVLLEATAKIDKRPEKLFEFLAPLQESGNLQTIPAAEHGPWRRVMLSVLAGRPSHEAHFAQFTALATGMADRWSARAADGPVALQKDLSELSLSMICQYALGSGLGSEESAGRVVSAFETVLTHYMGQADASGGEEARRAEEALAYLRATTDEVLAAHRERDDADRSDLIAALAAAGESPARIRDTVLMTMLAAHHTTGVAISWTLYLLARHPDAAERATAEVDEVLGDRPAPDYGDLRKLAHLDAVVKEAMRLYPPGPYGAREATEDLRLGDYTVPAGTTIFYPFWAVHMNPEYWPDPERFDPGRFTPEASAGRPRLAYIPFGLGPRSCEGAALAMVEAELVLAILLKRFRFELAPGQTITPIERFVLWAADDIRMNLTPR
ncbi:cytochrome P450 [Actinomadura madurae]|uniref:cytochrome P450 n=1 Tax=Actinomadura madurae TaxID=1993 RepID=UPI002026AE93|nr:cytochrome P450 [Actinomadura madurae]MCP9948496.1 cytochrome P450 [Actinomadura madurae]MCP9965277.1 cytochrome P450 [Actinomadura madurae]MCP9977766.1 cytochrome P450 [Actinomadura madurae]MCQ0010739.1 cytochrome P450 [Actinomadura madurae]URN04851.1 cytochrome P450 [Actinomadura madurae]